MKRHRRKHGQSLVEMAMIAPVLVLMLISVIDFGRAAYAYATLSAAVREGARTAIHTGSLRPADADVVAAVQKAGIGLNLSAGPCLNGPITAPATVETGWIFVVAGPGNTTTNAPSGEAAAPASGSCSPVNPSFAGRYPLSVVVKYTFQPFTPLAQQFLGNSLVISVTSTMNTEY